MKDEGEGETWIGKEGRKRLFRTLRDAIHAPCNKIQEEGGGREGSFDRSIDGCIHPSVTRLCRSRLVARESRKGPEDEEGGGEPRGGPSLHTIISFADRTLPRVNLLVG